MCTHVYIYIHIYTYMYIYMCICTYIYIYICVVFVIAIHTISFQDAKTVLEINPAEQAVRATALEQVCSNNLSCMHKFKLSVSLSLSLALRSSRSLHPTLQLLILCLSRASTHMLPCGFLSRSLFFSLSLTYMWLTRMCACVCLPQLFVFQGATKSSGNKRGVQTEADS